MVNMPSPYLKEFRAGGKSARLASLPAARDKYPAVGRMPVSLRIVLESLLRNLDGKRVREGDVKNLASWQPRAERIEEIPFVVSRVLLQDFTGVPLVVDLAAMRSAVKRAGQDPKLVEPEVPVDLVIDHSVQVDFARVANAIQLNMGIEFKRNRPRYEFLKWGMQAYDGLKIVPPGIGIVHQVNLEYLAKGILEDDGVVYPDTLVGTDSHTTMINGLGILAWGVGGIAAEYGATIGFFPVDEPTCQYLLATGRPAELVDRLRAYYQAQGLFGIPKKGQVDYTQVLDLDLGAVKPSVSGPKRPQDRIELPDLKGRFLELLQAPSPNGYGKPSQEIGKRFHEVAEPLPVETVAGGGAQDSETVPEVARNGITHQDTNPLTETEMMTDRPTPDRVPPQELHPIKVPVDIGHGDVLIAAITSCTNTSNPSVMLAAGLLAKKAVEKGLHVRPEVKTSLAPGSRVVSRYLEKTGLQPY